MNSHENKKLHLIHSTYYFCLVKKTTVRSVNDKADRDPTKKEKTSMVFPALIYPYYPLMTRAQKLWVKMKILNPGSRDISQKLRQTKCLLFNF